ncbi:efflux RND transporter periplasmic adaptor subunit [Lentisphaerota bacterium ZTH]|nr:efflux RND transporter periplasmic adaptor subunit [Lentisphaerota bacterium]WET05499.1 efflux RND transporter periplasmic adaptor subunit [Lentisphaerota bacterium ZTH]
MKITKWKTGSALVLVLVLIIGAWAGYRESERSPAAVKKTEGTDDSIAPDRSYTLKYGKLVIGLIQAGSVNAKKKHKLSLQANFRTKLNWVIDENTSVKKGQVLAKFETDNLREKVDDFNIQYENLEKELMIQKESEKILVSSNAAEVRAAEDRVVLAADALRKYRKFEHRKERDNLMLKIQEAESAYSKNRKEHQDKKTEVARGYSNRNEEEKHKQKLQEMFNKMESASNSLVNARNSLKKFKRYTHPNKMNSLINDYEQAQLNLRKVKISTASNLIQKKKTIDNTVKRMKRIKNDLKKYTVYLKQMQLTAPVDGVVIYGNPDRRWSKTEIKLGMDIWKGKVLMTIPDMKNLVVNFDLPEQYRSKVKLNDKVIVSPDSLPGIKLAGHISKIATLPVNMIYWDRSSPKIYKSRVTLEKQCERLVSGMSVQLEIVTKVIKNTLFVPVEAVFEKNDSYFVYLKTPAGTREETVSIGESNDNFVQITAGLKAGEVVYLYRPYQKKQAAGS